MNPKIIRFNLSKICFQGNCHLFAMDRPLALTYSRIIPLLFSIIPFFSQAQAPGCIVVAIERAHGMPHVLIEKEGTIYSFAHRDDTLLENSKLGVQVKIPKGQRTDDFVNYFSGAIRDAGIPVQHFLFLRIIFFDSNSALIRNDASAELDKLIELMQRYSFAEITIVVHTDRRGTIGYNRQLAAKRGESVKKYLADAKVLLEHVKVKASEEDDLITDCPDRSSCEELVHQFNRRVEFLFNPLSQKQ